jgi:hypothetical protein
MSERKTADKRTYGEDGLGRKVLVAGKGQPIRERPAAGEKVISTRSASNKARTSASSEDK